MAKHRFQVIAVDQNGDVWIVDSAREDSAKVIAQRFKDEHYKEVAIHDSEAKLDAHRT